MARKRKKAAEEGEVEANLLPVMNVMFLLIPALLLAMEVARFAAVNVTPPKFAASADQKKEKEEKDKPLNLKVFILEDGYRISASNQMQGADAGKSADASKPTIPLAKKGSNDLNDFERYDYAKLGAEAKKYKDLFKHETVVTISAENTIPMQVLINTMDAMRGTDCKLLKAMQGETVPEECLFWQSIVEAGAG